jgi:hypothetical protein
MAQRVAAWRPARRTSREAGGKGQEAGGTAPTPAGGVEAFLGQFGGGRAGLDAAISGWLPRTRLQGEREARRWAFKSMSFLLGRYSDASIGAMILHPSTDGRTCDIAHVLGTVGLRRLRVGESVALLGSGAPRRTCLKRPVRCRKLWTGERAEEGTEYPLRDYCIGPAVRLSCVDIEQDQRLFVLDPDEPSINLPATVITAQLIRNSWRRYADGGNPEERLLTGLRGPAGRAGGTST